jgi:hypothetical protein
MFYVFMPHCSLIDTKADGAGFENRPFRGGDISTCIQEIVIKNCIISLLQKQK